MELLVFFARWTRPPPGHRSRRRLPPHPTRRPRPIRGWTDRSSCVLGGMGRCPPCAGPAPADPCCSLRRRTYPRPGIGCGMPPWSGRFSIRTRPVWLAVAPGLGVLAANASEVPNLWEREPGIPAHGWQHLASLVVHTSFRAREVLPRLPPAGQALLRSQAGPYAGAWLTAIPSEEDATLTPNLMRIALRRRLRLPLPPAAQRCGQGAGRHGCGGALGDHALACPRSGLLARRGHVLEHAWIRVARETVGSEGRVVPQPWLAHTNLATAVDDRRRLDLLIHGATSRGKALACDVTLVSPLLRSGQPTRQAATYDGAALLAARARKHRRYPELLGGGPQRLLVLGTEVGGRWHSECL